MNDSNLAKLWHTLHHQPLLPVAPPALPVLHLVIVAGVGGLPEPVRHPAAVELLAPLVVLEELVQQGQVRTLSLQYEVVEVLVAQLLPGAALARRLPAPLQLG